jgi:hypothetical protein
VLNFYSEGGFLHKSTMGIGFEGAALTHQILQSAPGLHDLKMSERVSETPKRWGTRLPRHRQPRGTWYTLKQKAKRKKVQKKKAFADYATAMNRNLLPDYLIC